MPLLPPYRGVFVHLLLVGIPYRFGLLPTGWGRGWLFPSSILKERCSIFGQETCEPVEDFAIRDFGVRFLLHYELAWVVWVTMRKTNANSVAFHKILMGISCATLFWIAWLQNYFHPAPHHFEFDPTFFRSIVLYHLAAVSFSAWTVSKYPGAASATMKWSIPGNAVFIGAVRLSFYLRYKSLTTHLNLRAWFQVINVLFSVAAFQALLEEEGIESYYRLSVTPLIRMCFALSAFHTGVHAILLLRVRTFLNMPQLRAICLYKLIVNIVLPFFWFPELSPYMHVDQRITFAVRGVLTATYLLGFLWAGKAEGVSRILSGEKED